MSSVVSVNVGRPCDIEWNGRQIRTAIWKCPVPGKVMARRLNLDGDAQADLAAHGGENRAVMVYQLGSYRYWENYLQRHDFEHGQFGENLTVEGLPDDEVCIGDRYRIGRAVFEVTQPRVTCYRVGIRMSNPQMPALLVSHKRPGFYFRVIEEGEVGAGDEIVKVLEGSQRITVAEANALLYLPGRSHNRLQQVLSVPALSPGWRSSFQDLLACEFNFLRVAAIQRESADVLSFTFEAEDRRPLPPHLAGQFLVLKLQTEGSKSLLLRSYSISGRQGAGTYRVSVKRERGPGSHYLHDQVHANDLLQVSVPKGSFTLASGKGPVVFVSVGIGITPLLSMLHQLASSDEECKREIWWCYGARNREQHLFAAEVRGLLQSLSNSRSFVAYSKPSEADRQGADYDSVGHLSLRLLQERDVPQSADFYLCGPPNLLAELREELSAWGVPPSRIHLEAFGAGAASTTGIAGATSKKPHLPDGAAGDGPTVSFTKSGFSVPWSPRFKSLLELAEACDVPVTWSCRTGVCHACESELLGGAVRYAPEPLEDPANGNVLICCATPLSPVQVDI